MIGARVRVIYVYESTRVGTVIAESEDCVGVRFDDDPEVPAIIHKQFVGVVLT